MRKTKERTPVRTRKRLALRRLTMLLILLVVVSWLFPIINLTPRQAIRRGEERSGVHNTSVVTREMLWDAPRSILVYLTANDHGVVFGLTRLSVLGWEVFPGMEMSCDGGQAVYAQQHLISFQDTENSDIRCFFGRVDDPDIERLEVSLRRVSVWGKDGHPAEWEELALIQMDEESWHEQDGRRYFLLMAPKVDLEGKANVECFLQGYDGRGELVHEMQVVRFSGTGFSS